MLIAALPIFYSITSSRTASSRRAADLIEIVSIRILSLDRRSGRRCIVSHSCVVCVRVATLH